MEESSKNVVVVVVVELGLRTVRNRTVYRIVDVLSASVRTITAVTVVYTAVFALVSFSLKYMLVKSFMHNILA